MKAVAHKTIQSLHAFGRQIRGGSIAALPLLFAFILQCGFLIIAAGTTIFSLSAQHRDTNPPLSDEKRLDLLFEGIMQSLPHELRTEVDSAASLKIDRRGCAQTPENRRRHEAPSSETRLQELPDKLKVQVERTIVDMEKRSGERKAQFRELQRNRGKDSPSPGGTP